MFNFLKNNQENNKKELKEQLKKILTSLKDADDHSIQGISARYEVSLNNLLKKEFENRKLDFKEYEKMKNDMKSTYNDSKLDQKEKWTLISKMKKNPEYQKFIEAKKDINNLSNSLFRENPELTEYRDNFISIIGRHKDLMFFNDNNNILYRSVRASDEQELNAMFENGIYPQVLALDVYQTPTNLPYVNDAAIEKNIEQVGFTGGVVSLSSAASYSLYFANESINRGAKENFYLLAINPRKVSNIGEHIHKEVGYSGKNESSAQASEEFVASSVRPEDIYGARKLNKDGSIEPLIFNKNVLKGKRDFTGDKEFIKFAAFNHIDEYMIAECIEQPKVFEKIYEPYKVNEIKQKIEQMKKDDPKRFEEIKAIAEMENSNDHRRDFHRKNSDDEKSHKEKYGQRKEEVINGVLDNIGKKYGIEIISNNSRNSSIVDIDDIDLNGISPEFDENNGKNQSFIKSFNQDSQQNNMQKRP